jgi:hypothetical protein
MRIVSARASSKPHTMNKAIVWSKTINNDLTLLGRVYGVIVPTKKHHFIFIRKLRLF